MTDHAETNLIPFPQSAESNLLSHFDRARRELELAASIDEVKIIRNQAEALRQYARQQKLSLEMQNKCAEIKLRAERRAGEILSDMDWHPPGPSSRDRSHDGTDPPRLTDLGITKNQSSRWQSIAGIPEKQFESRVEEIKEKGQELTSSEFLSFAGYLQREQERHARKERAAEDAAKVKQKDRIRILRGDFREVLTYVPDNSVQLIITDPVYLKENLPDWEDLAIFAERVLKPGRLLAAYSGTYHLFECMKALSSQLRYMWTFPVVYRSFPDTFFKHRIKTCWKPIILFSKGEYEPEQKNAWIHDLIEGDGVTKENHRWEQGIGEACHLIEGLTYENELVVDPFVGSGTIGLAAKRLNRRLIGCDVDQDAVNMALARLAREPDNHEQGDSTDN